MSRKTVIFEVHSNLKIKKRLTAIRAATETHKEYESKLEVFGNKDKKGACLHSHVLNSTQCKLGDAHNFALEKLSIVINVNLRTQKHTRKYSYRRKNASAHPRMRRNDLDKES